MANPMWGGMYAQGPSEIMAVINASIGFDKKLYAQDIEGSLAHCRMLEKQGILTAEESRSIQNGLVLVREEIESGRFQFKTELEDIHMNVESRLKELIGEVAGKLHTARSRNDQVATDFRLFVRDMLDRMDADLQALQAALLNRAEEHAESIMPGFTHLQPAQPVTLGHHLLAYVEMFGRDRGRMQDARKRMNECPLGSAALAGTSFPLDRHYTAQLLGFDRPMSNSLDGVASRDFALEALSAFTLCASHLSRFAEELILWSTPQFGFLSLSDAFTSGSSIMPQKRNPDAAELVRGKSGRVTGALISLLTTVKGLPLAYNKDLQEDKEPVFDAAEHLTLCIRATTGMVQDATFHRDAMLRAAGSGHSTATDIADWLVRVLKLPFRNAHHITGHIVKLATEQGRQLWELPLEVMQSVEPRITEDIYSVLSVESSVHSRQSFGGTSPQRVREAIKQSRERYL